MRKASDGPKRSPTADTMVFGPCPGSQRPLDNEPESSQSHMATINNAKPSSSKSRALWPLDTFWSSSSKRGSPSQSRSPISPNPASAQGLARSYDSATGLDSDHNLDFQDLPLTPPDSGAPAFLLHAAKPDGGSASPPRNPVLVSTVRATPALLHDTEINSPPKGRSKNDIFDSPISWLTPPSRVAVPSSGSEASPPAPSRNSLFFSSIGSHSPTPPSPPPPRTSSAHLHRPLPGTKPSPQTPPPRSGPDQASMSQTPSAASESAGLQQPSARKKGHSRNSSLGRASSEECMQEEARIRTTKHVDFRLCPSNEYLLGEGRHCSVYLGSYRPRSDAVTAADAASPKAWRLCAIKRLHTDRQSQLLGLEEAFALRRLGLHPNIIQLIDIRDEVEFTTSPQPSPPLRDERAPPSSAGLGLGLGFPTSERRSAAQPVPAAQGSHSRSTSDMTGREEILHETKIRKRALAHEKQHEAALVHGILEESDPVQPRNRVITAGHARCSTPPTSTFMVQAPVNEALESSRRSKQGNTLSDQSVAYRVPNMTMSPPRLLILLELLPNNLALFARKYRERVDLQQWFDWARQMTEAVVFLHDRGCVHADIKKENMLLTEDLNIKLCDFNSAVFPNPSDPPRDGLGLGTPAYCAPELSRATGGPGATSFSFPIDIFSLGAVLYSLATGYEPFSKAHSVVEMLHRKRLFFESEENDRASRLAVEAGSNPASQPASRSGSLRGRHQRTHSSSHNEVPLGSASPTQLTTSLNRLLQYSSPMFHAPRREASSDSLESVASSITTISGRNPTSVAVSRLLETTDEPIGLLIDPSTPSRQSSLLLRDQCKADVRRCASTGGRKVMAASGPGLQRLRASGEEAGNDSPSPRGASVDQQSTAVPVGIAHSAAVKKASSAVQKVTNLDLTSRPDWLRRRSSYGDELSSPSHSSSPTSAHSSMRAGAPIAEEATATPSKPSGLRTMFSPTSPLMHFDSQSSSGKGATPSPADRATLTTETTRSSSIDAEDAHPYADGHPAIILPGGGRLPDWARDLLRSMLQADPASRPTAKQVRDRLSLGSSQKVSSVQLFIT